MQNLLNLLNANGMHSVKVEHTHAVLECLQSWIRSGSIPLSWIQSTPLIEYCFQSLKDTTLFDVAVDIIVEVILRSAKAPKNEAVIQVICPKLQPLTVMLESNMDDSEIVRGLCRILVEAGESYVDIIASNHQYFSGTVDAILKCASYDDLEIAKITFNFWFVLAEEIAPNPVTITPFLPVFCLLIAAVIKQLRYPDNLSDWKAQDRDEFREFRYVMGDVLKDCVRVLGQESLWTPSNMLQTFLINPAVTWQEIEAPLFSLRAMCREVSVSESKYLPEIMSLLPRLPAHPKIKYAAILVIGRYSEWTNKHPEMLSYQLDFVSNSFEPENQAAASATFKDMCRDCCVHMVAFLPQLHPFYLNTMKNIHPDDRMKLTEAISHVVSAVPLTTLTEMLELFCLPIAQSIHEKISLMAQLTIPEAMEIRCYISANLDQIDYLAVFLRNVKPVVEGSMHPCVELITKMWPIFDILFKTYGGVEVIAESLSRLFRNAVRAYGSCFYPILGQLIPLLLSAYQFSRLPCYVWLCGHIIRVVKSSEYSLLIAPLVVQIVTTSLEIGAASDQDTIEECYYLICAVLKSSPNLMSPEIFEISFTFALQKLPDASTNARLAILDYYASLPPSLAPQIQSQLVPMVRGIFVAVLEDFPSDSGACELSSDTLINMLIFPGTSTQIIESLFCSAIQDIPDSQILFPKLQKLVS